MTKIQLKYCKNCKNRMEQDGEILCSLTSKKPNFKKTCDKFDIDFERALENDRKAIFRRNNDDNSKAKEITEYPFWNSWNKKIVSQNKEIKILSYDKRIIYFMYLISFAVALIVGVIEVLTLNAISNLTISLIIIGFIGTTIFLFLILRYKRNINSIITIDNNGLKFKDKLYTWSDSNFVYITGSKGSFLTIKKPETKEINIKMDSLQYYPTRILNLIYQFKKENSEES